MRKRDEDIRRENRSGVVYLFVCGWSEKKTWAKMKKDKKVVLLIHRYISKSLNRLCAYIARVSLKEILTHL